MARSTTPLLLLLTALLLTTLLPILNHRHTHVLAAPVPIPVLPIPINNEPAALAVEHPNPSTIEKRQLLVSLLESLSSSRNEGGNAVQGVGEQQPVMDGIVPGGNTANIGAR